jgi:hypothetical protein
LSGTSTARSKPLCNTWLVSQPCLRCMLLLLLCLSVLCRCMIVAVAPRAALFPNLVYLHDGQKMRIWKLTWTISLLSEARFMLVQCMYMHTRC